MFANAVFKYVVVSNYFDGAFSFVFLSLALSRLILTLFCFIFEQKIIKGNCIDDCGTGAFIKYQYIIEITRIL